MLYLQALYSGELSEVRCDDCEIQRARMCGDEQVVGANGNALGRQLLPDCPVVTIRGRLQWQNFQCGENQIHSVGDSRRTRLRRTKAELSRDNDARTDSRFANRRYALGHRALRIAYQVGYRVGIQKITERHVLELHIVQRWRVFIHIGERLIQRFESAEQSEQTPFPKGLDN